MRGIWPRDGTVKAELGAIGVDPAPDHIRFAIGSREIDRAAVAVAPGRPRAAMERISNARLEPFRQPLAVIVAESAQHGPLDSGRIHCTPGMVELLAEIGVHSADRIFGQSKAHALGGGRVLPRK